MSTAPARRGGLQCGIREDEAWDKPAWKRTLWITTFCLTLAFIAWFLPQRDHPQAELPSYTFTEEPALTLGWLPCPVSPPPVLRILWMVMPPSLGSTRKMVSLTTLLLGSPPPRVGRAGAAPDRAPWESVACWILAGHRWRRVLPGLMPSTSFLLPRGMQGAPRSACRPAWQPRCLDRPTPHALPHRHRCARRLRRQPAG